MHDLQLQRTMPLVLGPICPSVNRMSPFLTYQNTVSVLSKYHSNFYNIVTKREQTGPKRKRRDQTWQGMTKHNYKRLDKTRNNQAHGTKLDRTEQTESDQLDSTWQTRQDRQKTKQHQIEPYMQSSMNCVFIFKIWQNSLEPKLMKTGLAGKDQTGPVKCPPKIVFCLLPLQLSNEKTNRK